MVLIKKIEIINIKGDQRMIIMVEILYVVVLKDIYHILHSIHILKQSMEESHLLVLILHNFKQEEVEVDLEK